MRHQRAANSFLLHTVWCAKLYSDVAVYHFRARVPPNNGEQWHDNPMGTPSSRTRAPLVPDLNAIQPHIEWERVGAFQEAPCLAPTQTRFVGFLFAAQWRHRPLGFTYLSMICDPKAFLLGRFILGVHYHQGAQCRSQRYVFGELVSQRSLD